MTGLGGLLLIAAGIFGPDGFAVHRSMLAASITADRIPATRLLEAADDTWVVWHRQPSWAMAFYSPPEDGVGLAAMMSAPGVIDRLLPGLRVPRLFLYAPVYQVDGVATSLANGAVDVSEAYYYALMQRWLDRERRRPNSWWRQLADARSPELMTEVPPALQVEAYGGAVAAFTAHLLSIAHEIARADRRAADRGKDLCGLLDPPKTLFELWRRSIYVNPYHGTYLQPLGPGLAPEPKTSERGLDFVDKQQILEGFFENRWMGQPAVDFAHLCPTSSE